MKIYFIFFLFIVTCSNHDSAPKTEKEETSFIPANLDFSIVNTYPHDTTSFTEGLFIKNGKLYESTGSPADMPNTRSMFGIVNLETGRIGKNVELDKTKYFGEGITVLNNKIYQLTYENKVGFIYDFKTFRKWGEFSLHNSEGWGLTTDGNSLLMSDGSATITYLDTNSFNVIKTIIVRDRNILVNNLNELEYIKGFIYANIYTKNYIVKINHVDGKVVGILNLAILEQKAKFSYSGALEMNGIAYDSINNRMYVTGKMWPFIFELSFLP